MEIEDRHWEIIRELFEKTFRSTMHYSFGTVNPDGSPNISAIGSIVLRDDKTGFYCEAFTRNIPRNINKNRRICVMGVSSAKLFWLKSLILGRFNDPPGVKLFGSAGERRLGTDQELNLWQKRIRPLRKFKGYDLLWKDLKYIRELSFDGFEPINAGVMTQGLWG